MVFGRAQVSLKVMPEYPRYNQGPKETILVADPILFNLTIPIAQSILLPIEAVSAFHTT